MIGSKGQYSSFFYLFYFNDERPVTSYYIPKETTLKNMLLNNSIDLILMDFVNGEIRIAHGSNPHKYLSINE